LCRLLEPLTLGRFDHPALEGFHQFLVLAFQKHFGEVHSASVLLSGTDRVDARRDAPLDVVFQAWAPAFTCNHLVARSDPEQTMRQRHGFAREGRGKKRPGVKAAVALDTPRDEDARKRLVRRELQVWVVLVVAEPN